MVKLSPAQKHVVKAMRKEKKLTYDGNTGICLLDSKRINWHIWELLYFGDLIELKVFKYFTWKSPEYTLTDEGREIKIRNMPKKCDI